MTNIPEIKPKAILFEETLKSFFLRKNIVVKKKIKKIHKPRVKCIEISKPIRNDAEKKFLLQLNPKTSVINERLIIPLVCSENIKVG